jgi:hypothetical protein
VARTGTILSVIERRKQNPTRNIQQLRCCLAICKVQFIEYEISMASVMALNILPPACGDSAVTLDWPGFELSTSPETILTDHLHPKIKFVRRDGCLV